MVFHDIIISNNNNFRFEINAVVLKISQTNQYFEWLAIMYIQLAATSVLRCIRMQTKRLMCAQ